MPQRLARELPAWHVIVDDENGFRSASSAIERLPLARCIFFGPHRQIDKKRGPVAGFAFEADVSTALLDQTVHGSESQSGVSLALPGCEERLEHLPLTFVFD